MTGASLSFERLNLGHYPALVNLFMLIAGDHTSKNFHPHLFDQETALAITTYKGKDSYIGAFSGHELIGYGMLRGWDAGYNVPSLGIYLAPLYRGRGYAKVFMLEMHRQAYELGATQIRLKVYASNLPARRLYEQLGYIFASEECGQMVGYVSRDVSRIV